MLTVHSDTITKMVNDKINHYERVAAYHDEDADHYRKEYADGGSVYDRILAHECSAAAQDARDKANKLRKLLDMVTLGYNDISLADWQALENL